MVYTNSNLVTYKNISPNRTNSRNHIIDTITIHCIVGQWTAKQGCDYFASTTRKASCNYVVGKDGSIGLCVEEKDRSWCSSNAANDNRAVTIEVASDTKHPYAVTNKALNALIELVADICKRNDIKELKWSTNKTDRVYHRNGCNMTVHRDFANKACPGKYLYDKHPDIAEQVNKKLNAFIPYKVKVTAKGLNIREGAGVKYDKVGTITDQGIYTIVEEAVNGSTKWGLLKSYEKNRNGWISLSYTNKI